MSTDRSITFLGAGRIARALARGFVASGLVPAVSISAIDPAEGAVEAFRELIPGVNAKRKPDPGPIRSRLVILAVKPQMLAEATRTLSALPGTCFLSVVAGVSLDTLGSLCGTGRIVRAMPNTPALISEGATAWCAGPEISPSDAAWIRQLLESVGIALEVEERLMDAVTGLSGSGPAFVFRFVEALMEGGVLAGLPPADARCLAIQTVLGSARLLDQTGGDPRALAEQVTSPGGTTECGLRQLDGRSFASIVRDAVIAAADRAASLGAVRAV